MRRLGLLLMMAVACDASSPAGGGGAGDGGPSVGSGAVPDSCPAGEAPLPDSDRCTPIGPRCAAGFERHASGHGCVPLHSGVACKGATRDALGETGCVPLGDCNAAFPPPDATLFVEAGASGPGRFGTLQAALDAAPSGAVIALADGTYRENVVFDRAVKVTVVGRCAEKATLEAASSTTFVLANGGDLTVRGLTLRGGLGLTSAGAESVLIAEDVLVTDAREYALGASKGHVRLSRSVIRNVKDSKAAPAFGLFAVTGATVELDEAEIASVLGVAVVAHEPKTVVRLRRTLVRDTRPHGVVHDGFGIEDGARLEVIESAILGPLRHGVLLEKNATVSLTRSTLAGVVHGGANDPGYALSLDKSSLNGEDFTLADSAGVGLSVETPGSRATLLRSAFVAMRQDGSPTRGIAVGEGGVAELSESVILGVSGLAGLVAGEGSRLELSRSLVSASRPFATSLFALGATRGGTLKLTTSTVDDSRVMAVVASRAGTNVVLDGALVRRIDAEAGLLGASLFVQDGARARLEGTTLDRASAVGLLVAGGGVSFVSGALSRNGVAVAVQEGSRLVEEDPKRVSGGPLDVQIAPGVRFTDNVTRLGEGPIVVPALDL